MKILIVEDERDMLQNMADSLDREGYVVEKASNLQEAANKIGVYAYDCILLDIGLPDGNGFELIQLIQESEYTGAVIVVSAKDSLEDKVQGLDLGADDYLPKPFHMAELHARVKAVLRRKKFDGSSSLELSNLIIDTDAHIVHINKRPINLNRKEFQVLLYLCTNRNRLVTKTALAEHVWGDHIDQADNFEFIYSQIKNLRKKLQNAGAELEIKAVYGIGYKLLVT